MKHTSIFLFAVVAAICSCSKDIIDRTAEDSGNLSITALGTKTVLDGTSVNWTSNDVLVVFDNENTGVNFTTTADKTSYATFTTSNWTGKTPVYASCSQAGADAACSSGILTVKLDPAQVVKDKSTYAENASASVGIVSGNVGEYTISEMKNVQGLIRFSLKTGFVGSISVEAVNGEAIAGFVDVDYSKIAGGESAFWTATPGKKQSSTITLTPDGNAAKDGLFDAGVYYVSVLPQTYAKGLRFVVMDKGGDTLCSRTVGSETGLSIARSKIVKLDGNLDNIDTLPETISLELDFNNDQDINPFGFGALAADKEDAQSGEKYTFTYNYTYSGIPMSEELSFVICKGKNTGARYRFYQPKTAGGPAGDHSVLNIDKAWGWIMTPAIEGRYLQSVTITIANTSAKKWKIRGTSNGNDITDEISAQGSGSTPGVGSVSFMQSSNPKPELSAPYYIFFTMSSVQIMKLELTYMKTLPQ